MTDRLERRWDRSLVAGAVLAALAFLSFGPEWLSGRALFWGDLTYLHHPWRAFDATVLAGGRLPVWNPFVYFGMPAAASMQDSLFYPGTVPFFFWGFGSALSLYEIALVWLSGFFTHLWLRRAGLSHAAALGGAVLYSLGGLLWANRVFLNHTAVLVLMPALFLFLDSPVWLAAVLSCGVFAGYPPFMIGAVLSAWALTLIGSGETLAASAYAWARRWAKALAAAFCCSAALLWPAAELFSRSRRSAGMDLSETLMYGFHPADLFRWISPVFYGPFDPGRLWWKACHLGFVGLVGIVLGFRALPRRRSVPLMSWGAAVLLLTLGDSSGPARWCWGHLLFLRFVRYPGNLAYLAWPPAVLAAAAGFERLGRPRRWIAFVAAAELLLYGWGSFPLARPSLFTEKGALVELLQARLDGHRYLLSPRALQTQGGLGVEDWKERLYGLTNAPFRIRAAGNFGEPLVPESSYGLMDALYRASSAAAAAAFFPWADIACLLTPASLPPAASGPFLRREGRAFWDVYELFGKTPSRAFFLTSEEAASFPEGPSVPRAPLRPLESAPESREDRFVISGDTPAGWAFVSEPRYPGWEAYLETPLGAGRVLSAPALGAFQRVPVPGGRWRLHFLYNPISWRIGILLSAAAFLALGLRARSAVRRALSVWSGGWAG